MEAFTVKLGQFAARLIVDTEIEPTNLYDKECNTLYVSK
jgi:hypothetical protein